jgi:hypothetical protein
VAAIIYHDTVNDVQGLSPWGTGPFARREWFALLEAHGHRPLLAVARDGAAEAILPLVQGKRGLEMLTNWYAFTCQPVGTGAADETPLEMLARALASRTGRIELAKLADESGTASRLESAFRKAGWSVFREPCDNNHFLPVNGRSYAEYLAGRPGPLRTTLKRKARKVELRLSQDFDPADWAAFEDIYCRSWKPAEGDPALLRAFAEGEAVLGHMRFGLALAEGEPVAAQFWTVEHGRAYIHKLAHLPEFEPLSPGTTLTAALMEQVIDRDRVTEVDFGTGNDRYKADWMDGVRPRFRLVCLRKQSPANWPELAQGYVRALVQARRRG